MEGREAFCCCYKSPARSLTPLSLPFLHPMLSHNAPSARHTISPTAREPLESLFHCKASQHPSSLQVAYSIALFRLGFIIILVTFSLLFRDYGYISHFVFDFRLEGQMFKHNREQFYLSKLKCSWGNWTNKRCFCFKQTFNQLLIICFFLDGKLHLGLFLCIFSSAQNVPIAHYKPLW